MGVDALPDSADEATAKAKYEELFNEDRKFSMEQIMSWFGTWDPDKTMKIPFSKLQGDVENVKPLSDDELAQFQQDLGDKIDGNGMWTYTNYANFMADNQEMKLGSTTF